jgi:membrane fusion protein (multidrug efflux system)
LKVKITFSIPEKYANQIKKNTVLSFKVSGSKYSATIYAIEPSVEVSTRTLQVRAIAENKDGKLLPGTFADVELPLDVIIGAIVIPTQAVILFKTEKVFISDFGKAGSHGRNCNKNRCFH